MILRHLWKSFYWLYKIGQAQMLLLLGTLILILIISKQSNSKNFRILSIGLVRFSCAVFYVSFVFHPP